MFSLGNKEAIVNSSAKYAYSKTGTVTSLKGLCSFKQANVLEAWGQRFIAARVGKLTITPPTAASLGILATDVNVPVKVHIRVNTTRHTSEWATDFIKRGRPFIFELLVNGGETAAQIGTKLYNAFVAYEQKFNWSDKGLPFSYVDGTGTVALTLKDPYLMFQKRVEFLAHNSIYGVSAVTTAVAPFATPVTATGVNALNATTVNVSSTAEMRVGDNIVLETYTYTVLTIPSSTSITIAAPGLLDATAGGEAITLEWTNEEPTFDGKYLEENVRMSTENTSDSYGISPNEKPVLSGNYTTITFKVANTEALGGIDGAYKGHKNLGLTADGVSGDRIHTFTLYILEGSDCFGTGNYVDDLVVDLIAGTPNITTFYKANKQAASSVADFIA